MRLKPVKLMENAWQSKPKYNLKLFQCATRLPFTELLWIRKVRSKNGFYVDFVWLSFVVLVVVIVSLMF